MPFLEKSSYNPVFMFGYGHFATIYAGAVSRVPPPEFRRERLELDDGDFLLIDNKLGDNKRAIILCHGLEGNSKSTYNNACAHYFLDRGYSVFAWNNRGCGGEPNRLPQMYHHASVEDLGAVVSWVMDKGFEELFLIGFSLGGAQILNYLGRMPAEVKVKAAMAVSTPIDLGSSSERMNKGLSRIYQSRFLGRIKAKLEVKARKFPEKIPLETVSSIKNFRDLAARYLAPFHGFSDLEDYFKRASPAFSIENITTPVLILNALDDPILGDKDYPVEFARKNPYVYLETPEHGGHCAFVLPRSKTGFAARRAEEFFKSVTGQMK